MSSSLIDRLVAHRTLGAVPREQLEWLVAHGSVRTLEPGDILTPSTGPVKGLYIILDGYLLIRVDRGAGPRIVMEWHGGDVTGMLPYSRIKAPPGNVVAEERSDILAIPPAELPQMIQECHELTSVLVHVMVDRARVFKSSELLDEKMASLGRLAAGLAHELNNPASAVARSAKTLQTELAALNDAARRFHALNLSEAQHLAISSLRDERAADNRQALTPLALADRQDALDDWLAAHGLSGLESETLASAGFRADDLEKLRTLAGEDKLAAVLAHLVSGRTISQLAAEINIGATRIHTLVAAVKGFTYVNQQATLMPIAIGQGLADTVTVLQSKARAQSVAIEVNVPPDLPAVEGYGGELNQVWANLIDNAIDATPGGHVRLTAECTPDSVVVRVIDDGPGVPPEIANRVFDPFFTTKEIGKGTGLGLDISRRIVMRHRGSIDLHTGPQGTELRVTLPRSITPPAPAPARA